MEYIILSLLIAVVIISAITLVQTLNENRASRKEMSDNLNAMRAELSKSIETLTASNAKNLEEMRLTVNEKLEKTLETRLQKSFESVCAQLENVNKGLGEMRTVADSVGSLNKVLTNVKTRGIMGELQLGQIIEDMLPPHLYEKEVATVKDSRERADYAVKLPGIGTEHVFLPIDSKFPMEDYLRLCDGYEAGDSALIEASRKALYTRIKAFAKDVKQKYVSPPDTTNFAVIFLPTEGLYSEIVRDPVFFEELRRGGIVITGPTTLAAMLNSLQVGFKTLQIQKGAAEIEKTLGMVKKEFDTFEAALVKAQSRITQAGNEIETLVGTRTRAINRSLREVQVYDEQLKVDS
ncbi:MAG: DNA recombination protein RmuC [Oscillospiraceae bacterium]|nr:DNA recombination protein RmuC [Oscillospiraceae bacterium]